MFKKRTAKAQKAYKQIWGPKKRINRPFAKKRTAKAKRVYKTNTLLNVPLNLMFWGEFQQGLTAEEKDRHNK